ncbi:MAG: histidine kinase [Tannerella sp.]|jgi:YHS domain-containing protein|nr:histidine kinase [Tannerella sp.]
MSRSSGYRIGRYALLILAVLFISLNQVYMGFIEYNSLLGARIYLFMMFILLSYLIEGYFNIYILIPKLFLRGRYASYFVIFSITILLFALIHFGFESLVFKLYDVQPGAYSYYKTQGSPLLLEFAASYLVDYIAILGTGVTVILKHWLMNDQKVYQLEKIHVQTEVDKMKEQVNPQFQFSVLNKIGDLAPENQEKASDLLMELSDILRYQLYDCNREKVLLSAEIRFITTYLQVEKLHHDKMDFEIRADGDTNHLFIPPLLFIPLVQSAVKSFRDGKGYFQMHLYFCSEENLVSFRCDCKDAGLLSSSDLIQIKQRLDHLYCGKHVLRIEHEETSPVYFIYLQIRD